MILEEPVVQALPPSLEDRFVGYHQVVSTRWDPDAFALLPLTEDDLVTAAQDWVDHHVQSHSDPADYRAAVLAAEGTWLEDFPVPAIDQYYPTESRMDKHQLRFFQFWKDRWREGRPVDVEGNVGYVYAYVYEVLALSLADALPEMDRLADWYAENPALLNHLNHWRADLHMLSGDFEQALRLYRASWNNASAAVSLSAFLGKLPTGEEIARLSGVDLKTKFRTQQRHSLFMACEEIYAESVDACGKGGLEEWLELSRGYNWPIFTGAPVRTAAIPPGNPQMYWLDRNAHAVQACKRIMQGAEDLVRARGH